MSYIDDVFGSSGPLAARFDEYAPREGQIRLASEIDSMIALSEHLVSEAPTGTGKSLAYLVPSIYHATQNGRRVLVVTANIALQEQIVRKDLPMLSEILPWEFRYALAKGRSNYVCLEQRDKNSDKLDASIAREVLDWIDETTDGSFTELADRVEFVSGKTQGLLSIDSSDCLGTDCDYYPAKWICDGCGDTFEGSATKQGMECSTCGKELRRGSEPACFVERAKLRAREAHVVVANYHLLFADLVVRARTEGHASVLPPFDVVVMDEAHRAAEIARDFMGDRITTRSITNCAAGMVGMTKQRMDLERLTGSFFEALYRWGKTEDARPRFRGPMPLDWEALVAAVEGVRKWYETESALEAKRKKAYVSRCERVVERIAAVCMARDDRFACFVDYERDRAVLRSKMIYPAEPLRELLFEHVNSAIMTSATLTVGGKFDHLIAEIGIPEPSRLVVESPFDLRRQCKLIIDTTMPDPSKERFEYAEAIPERVEEIVRMARGRTLVLCTSNRSKEAVYQRLTSARLPYRILVQGAAHERTKIVREFKRDVSSVLIGTESFWAGVDVPGEALSCVVIDRIPFATPDDPVLDAISAKDDRWFWRHAVPRAVIQFKQGFGRLVRAMGDRGVVVCLDPRVAKKSYGRSFTQSIGDVDVSFDLGLVAELLGGEQEPISVAAI